MPFFEKSGSKKRNWEMLVILRSDENRTGNNIKLYMTPIKLE